MKVSILVEIVGNSTERFSSTLIFFHKLSAASRFTELKKKSVMNIIFISMLLND
jgi:hypothetical protein